ncbi:MAG: CTP synthase [Candidatus Woykebacteria bacterium RIFCSPHIGHO2_12_FULL_45_10]|uniref:CTP synthase n=1 Tax=Candidatus Woykebacteria bacterium RIFCSPHIGHO2_12_FULL_45_10 TaxID=1802603 RepID=A0A1G1WRB0_9BACT|nr:MAG: CTP synthase [Candidatus Woykebacteria bacterium RIFCSPHIGHO2_12_FULL_45_10]
MAKTTKFIFVSGGVISGIGKGITTASLALILKSKGYKVSPVKIDMYLNVDAGTIRPQEHGEVFVTDDGIETDQDLGHYERFLDTSLTAANYITTGQVYQEVLRKERAFEYDGEDVEAIPHVTDEIIRRLYAAGQAKEADIVLVELGGTVGEYQNTLFFEASRILRLKHPHDVLQVHVAYLPIPASLGEMKSKPVQQSVRSLNSMGIQPDIIIGRSELPIDQRRKERLALFCNVEAEDVISNPDVKTIYQVPLILQAQNLGERDLDKLSLSANKKDLKAWSGLFEQIQSFKQEINIALVGKYFATGDFQLSDVYVSVIEALKHAGWYNSVQTKLHWIDSEDFEKGESVEAKLAGMDGIVVPGGFGDRGVEGMIKAVQFAREEKIPYLGLCYGMHMATIEVARHKLKLEKANTTEIDEKTPHPVINIMPEQEKLLIGREYGGTMRLGSYPCKVRAGTLSRKAYGQEVVHERHRHRYEFNSRYRDKFENAGLTVAGTSLNGKLVEMVELEDHPFFVGTQFHPEFKSRPLQPHPLFAALIKAAKNNSLKVLSPKQELSVRADL